MRKIFLFLASLLIIISGYSQQSLQVENQKLEIRAVKNEEPTKIDISDFEFYIDYETGELLAKIDLYNTDIFDEEKKEDRIPGGEEIEINGIIPINEILDEESYDRSFTYELRVTFTDKDVTILFDFIVMDIPTSQNNAKIFQVQGTMDLRDFEIENLMGYEPEVMLFLEFNTHMIGG